jgi:hypothetical protein
MHLPKRVLFGVVDIPKRSLVALRMSFRCGCTNVSYERSIVRNRPKIANPREFTQVEKEEQEVAEACNRLIKNSIICWNYLYLTRQVEKAPDTEARKNLLRLIASHSPMSWAHINMLGEYDFSEEKLRDTLGILPPKKAA